MITSTSMFAQTTEYANFKKIHSSSKIDYFCLSPVFLDSKSDSMTYFKLVPLNAKRSFINDRSQKSNNLVTVTLSGRNDLLIVNGPDTTARIPWDFNYYRVFNGLKWYKAKDRAAEISYYDEGENFSRTIVWHNLVDDSFTYYVWVSGKEDFFEKMGYIAEKRKR